MDELLSTPIKASEQYCSVVLFIMLCKGVLKCDQSNEGHWKVLSYGAVYYVLQRGCNFWGCGWNQECYIQMKVTEVYSIFHNWQVFKTTF